MLVPSGLYEMSVWSGSGLVSDWSVIGRLCVDGRPIGDGF